MARITEIPKNKWVLAGTAVVALAATIVNLYVGDGHVRTIEGETVPTQVSSRVTNAVRGVLGTAKADAKSGVNRRAIPQCGDEMFFDGGDWQFYSDNRLVGNGTKLVADPGHDGVKIRTRDLRGECVNRGMPSHVVISTTDDKPSVLWKGDICSSSIDNLLRQLGADNARSTAQEICDSYVNPSH